MNSIKDILLVNSLAPRQRSISDCCLENSLAILKTYLTDKGFRAEVLDFQRINLIQQGIPVWYSKLSRAISKQILKLYRNKSKRLIVPMSMINWPVQLGSTRLREKALDKYIKDVLEQISKYNIPLVGIKVWYGDSFIWSMKLADEIRKKCPGTIIIAGGPHVNVYKELILEAGKFDFAVDGPGEKILEDMLRIINSNEDIDSAKAEIGKRFEGEKLLSVDKLDLEVSGRSVIPDYSDEDKAFKLPLHPIIDARGCTWAKCNFCTHSSIQKKWCARNVEDIISEIKSMVAQNIVLFRFTSSETPYHHGKAIAEAILENKLKINYSMFARAAGNKDGMFEAYRLMIRSGLRAVFIGGETGHDEINDRIMNKGVGRQDIIDTINCIRTAAEAEGQKCYIGLALIYPTPLLKGISLDDVFEENVKLIRLCMPDTVLITPPSPFYGTEWYDNPGSYGFEMADSFMQELMRYEYVLYKPTEFWPKLNVKLNGKSMTECLAETGRLRKETAKVGIPTDITDEYFIMAEALGLTDKKGISKFKEASLTDILSGTNDFTREIYEALHEYSRQLGATHDCNKYISGL